MQVFNTLLEQDCFLLNGQKQTWLCYIKDLIATLWSYTTLGYNNDNGGDARNPDCDVGKPRNTENTNLC